MDALGTLGNDTMGDGGEGKVMDSDSLVDPINNASETDGNRQMELNQRQTLFRKQAL